MTLKRGVSSPSTPSLTVTVTNQKRRSWEGLKSGERVGYV